jgi:GDP-D-mannose dehydratase
MAENKEMDKIYVAGHRVTVDCVIFPAMQRGNLGSIDLHGIQPPDDEEVPEIKIDSRYFRSTEVETLLDDPIKAKEKIGWVPEITRDYIVQEMVATDLADAKKHALLW